MWRCEQSKTVWKAEVKVMVEQWEVMTPKATQATTAKVELVESRVKKEATEDRHDPLLSYTE